MFLDDILISKQQEVEAAKAQLPLEDLRARLRSHQADRSFRKANAGINRLAFIAELKRKSPSKGMLRERFDPVNLAQSLEAAGAEALSVLTDEPFFGGELDFLRDAKQFTEIPVLRKDFVIDPYQVYQAVAFGADAVLLIVRILQPETLVACLEAADAVDVEPLVEVHGEDDLRVALSAGAHVIGINHRDLQTFTMDATLAERLVPKIPAGKIIVAESGIQSQEDVQRLRRLGVHAVLVGETLMRARDPGAKLRELMGAA
jgi:indole-3-glycerol phosphate synthase